MRLRFKSIPKQKVDKVKKTKCKNCNAKSRKPNFLNESGLCGKCEKDFYEDFGSELI